MQVTYKVETMLLIALAVLETKLLQPLFLALPAEVSYSADNPAALHLCCFLGTKAGCP